MTICRPVPVHKHCSPQSSALFVKSLAILARLTLGKWRHSFVCILRERVSGRLGFNFWRLMARPCSKSVLDVLIRTRTIEVIHLISVHVLNLMIMIIVVWVIPYMCWLLSVLGFPYHFSHLSTGLQSGHYLQAWGSIEVTTHSDFGFKFHKKFTPETIEKLPKCR